MRLVSIMIAMLLAIAPAKAGDNDELILKSVKENTTNCVFLDLVTYQGNVDIMRECMDIIIMVDVSTYWAVIEAHDPKYNKRTMAGCARVSSQIRRALIIYDVYENKPHPFLGHIQDAYKACSDLTGWEDPFYKG